MRPPKVQEEDLLAGLLVVLRAKGYDGASLNDLAESTGLKKASLYHRFPGGKKEITEVVLKSVSTWIEEHIHKTLIDSNQSVSKRLKRVLSQIREFYANGESICILRSLSMDTGLEIFGSHIQSSMQVWIDGFTQLGKDAGMTTKTAELKAQDVLIKIQGSLVVSKGLGTTKPFLQVLKEIEQNYLDK